MVITCPKCNTQHDVSGRKAGEKFTCSCGNVLAVPAGAGPAQAKKSSFPVWAIVLIVLGVMVVPCIGILAAIAIPNFIKFQERSKQMEARTNLRMLCTEEVAYHAEHDEWLAAGPSPSAVPSAKMEAFPADPNFKKLGFEPGQRVRYQYEVIVEGDPKGPTTPVRCVARGDLNGNGRTSLFEVRIGEDGQPGPVRSEHETE
jgi:Tfp pilus assembly protein PilE